MKRWKLRANSPRPNLYSSSMAFWIQWANSLEGNSRAKRGNPALLKFRSQPGCSEGGRLGQRRLRTVLKSFFTLKVPGAQPAETESQVENYVHHLRRQRR